jgi:hypothetical protein
MQPATARIAQALQALSQQWCALQVPYPTSAVIAGLLKMNMVRFVYWHDSCQWRLVLREKWLHAATQPDAVAHGLHLTKMVRCHFSELAPLLTGNVCLVAIVHCTRWQQLCTPSSTHAACRIGHTPFWD